MEIINMTEQIKDLELVSVEYDNGTATLTFLDSDQGEIREVNIRKTKYDQDKKKQVPDEQAAIRAEETAMEYLGVSFDEIETVVDKKFPVYIYEKFNSLKPVVVIENSQQTKWEQFSVPRQLKCSMMEKVFVSNSKKMENYVNQTWDTLNTMKNVKNGLSILNKKQNNMLNSKKNSASKLKT